MPISISSFSIMPLLLVVLCSLPTSIRSRASKQDAALFFFFLDLGPPRTASVVVGLRDFSKTGAYQVGSLMEVSSSPFHRRSRLSGAAAAMENGSRGSGHAPPRRRRCLP